MSVIIEEDEYGIVMHSAGLVYMVGRDPYEDKWSADIQEHRMHFPTKEAAIEFVRRVDAVYRELSSHPWHRCADEVHRKLMEK